MWKLYLIEILGNSIWFFGLVSIILTFIVAFYYGYCIDEDIKVNARRIKALIACSLICISITILMPSKKFMYVTLGINETIDFIQNNEEAKKISSKTLQIINNKLDKYLDADSDEKSTQDEQ